MAEADLEEEVALAPDAASMLARARVGWLAPVREQLAAMHERGRLPHGILLAGVPGAGQPEIGAWLAALLLCRATGSEPCGSCADCRLVLAGSHPDYRWISVLPDKKQISIEQMQALSANLALRSYRGGAKVSVISPVEAMSAKAHNALLKTLEEPPADTYLVLAASRIDRIPKTILSRCMRIALPLPGTAAALVWLRKDAGDADWPALLGLAGGAPFQAEELAGEGLDTLEAEMQSALAAAAKGQLDIVAFAEASAKNAPAARLAWLESWLTRSLKEAALSSDLVNNNRLPWLRPPGRETKIRAGFGLLDQLREARRQAGGSLNMQLLFEGLAISLAALLGPPAGKSRESLG
jgi:DNA polymerase-3 subunit delta'